MDTPDRRLVTNARLRQQISDLQASHRRMKETADLLDQQTLDLARTAVLVKLPQSELEKENIGQLLQLQKETLEAVKLQMLGPRKIAPSNPLIDEEEMAALLRLSQ